MTNEKQLSVLKSVCWIGAIADGFWTIALLWPALFVWVTGNADLNPDLSTRLIMGIAASLMAGWTCLLVWAANNPVERKAVLLFTAIPVVAGLIGVTIIGMMNGSSATVWILIKCSLLGFAMLYGYHTANVIARGGEG
ncbi:MAG: hypothetical protein ABIJ59_15255 [Pseudomonadota bacterium]